MTAEISLLDMSLVYGSSGEVIGPQDRYFFVTLRSWAGGTALGEPLIGSQKRLS